MTVEVAERLFSIDEYYSMAEAGILKEDERTELIRGRIMRMSAPGSQQASTVMRVNALFFRYVDQAAIMSVRNPVRLDDHSEPQPDVALLRRRDDFYGDAHPSPPDVLLIVEVADSSDEYDRDVKLPLYAQADIPEAWIVCRNDDHVLVHRDPVGGAYDDVRQAQRGETIGIRGLPNLAINVADILG